jgi:protein SCO1/2
MTRRTESNACRRILAAFSLVALVAGIAPARAIDRMEETPDELKNVGSDERLGAPVPLDLAFTDSAGGEITLGQVVDGTKPVLLTMNYSNCPRLCSLQLNGLFRGLDKLAWDLGNQFRMITVSIDPNEPASRAAETKRKYLEGYGREAGAGGWWCLVGREENIRRLADAVGFRYVYVEETKQFAHAAVTIVLTPDGRVSRYLYGIEYDPQTLRLALVEAGEGKVGSTVDKVLLFCFRYDSAAGKYAPAAQKIMTAGASLFAVLLGGALLTFWGREALRARRARRHAPAEQGDAASSASPPEDGVRQPADDPRAKVPSEP